MSDISIYGAGHLTKSLLVGLIQVNSISIKIFNRTPSKLDLLSLSYPYLIPAYESQQIAQTKSFILSIIPAVAVLNLDNALIEKIEETESILVSCVNGLSIEKLEEKYPSIKIIRVLPNTNWCIRQGITLIKANSLVSEQELEEISTFFGQLSLVHMLKNEEDFDRLGILTSCMPGLFSEIAHQLWIEFDISAQQEQQLIYQAIKNTIEYLIQSEKSPKEVIEEVANKGGLTEVGVSALTAELPLMFSTVYARMQQKIQQRRKEFAEL
ncbi:MAG: pyrroline-5-carboxylate reductase [Cyanobacteriota bacterium]|jgi:pyrroline-5-carboxylate reductase